MPGSKNRTKGNVKPSSSSQAARLLSESGAAPTGFVGFGGLGGMPAYVPASQALDDVDSTLDADFRMVLRKLTKRDSTTKVKALGEFSTLCKEKEDATVQAVLPFWPRIFNKMAIDIDHRVRECTQNAMTTLVRRVGRNIAPYLKNVMGAWLLSQNDTYPTVASSARKGFNAAFPDSKKESAVAFCKQVVAEYLVDNLLNQIPSSLSDPKTTPAEEMEAKYQRVLSCSLLALRQLLQTLPPADMESIQGHVRGLLNDGKFWKLSKSTVLTVRSGQFWFVGSLCQAMPDVAQEYVGKLSPLVLGSIDTSEPGMIAAVWDAVLSLVKYLPDCWQHVNWQKAFWPKLRSLLESGCQGNAVSIVPNILPLLSCVPMEVAGGAVAFLPNLLDHFKLGFMKDCVLNSASETNAFTKGYVECVQYAFRQIQEVKPRPDGILQTLFLDQLLPVFEASLVEPKPALSRSPLYTMVSAFIAVVEKNSTTSQFASTFWAALSENVTEHLESIPAGGEHYLQKDRLVLLVRALVLPQDVSKLTGPSKTERVKFAADEIKPSPRVAESPTVDLSPERQLFVEKVVVQSHKLFQEKEECVYLKLFASLANLYFPANLASVVLQNTNTRTEEGSGEGAEEISVNPLAHAVSFDGSMHKGVEEQARKVAEDSQQTASGVENIGDAHTGVIQKVVLPMLGNNKGDPDTVDHVITLLFACLPHLSAQNSTVIWEKVLQSATSASELCCLIERALDKRPVMPQVSDWLCSPYLTSRLRDLVTTVTTRHADMQAAEMEQSWRIICLVLSTNDDSEPVFPVVCIQKIISSIHSELVSLSSRTMDLHDVQVAVEFVSRAALTFFRNLKMSLSLAASQELITALILVDLDAQFPTAESHVREAWSVGLGDLIRQTGGFLQDGGLLVSCCALIRDVAEMKTDSMEKHRRLVLVTRTLLLVMADNLPSSDEELPDNPCIMALLPLLLTHPPCHIDLGKVMRYLCIGGQLPLNVFEGTLHVEDKSSMAIIVFSALFNLWLLHYYHTDCRKCTDSVASEEMERREGGEAHQTESLTVSSTKDWSAENLRVLLHAVETLKVANTCLVTEPQTPAEERMAVSELSVHISHCISMMPDKTQMKLADEAVDRANQQSGISALVVRDVLHMLDKAGVKMQLEKIALDDRLQCSSHGKAVLESLSPFLGANILMQEFRTQAAVLESIEADSLPLATDCLRLMGACLENLPEDSIQIIAAEIQGVLTRLKHFRDEAEDLYLFTCDVSDQPGWRVAFNNAAMQLMASVLYTGPSAVTPDLWDFLLCSCVCWCESLVESQLSPTKPVSALSFCVSCCQLVAWTSHTIQQYLPFRNEAFPPNLETEWKEFFSGGLFSSLLNVFVKLVGEVTSLTSTAKGESILLLTAVGRAVCLCPQEQVLSFKFPPYLLASEDTSPLPESLQTVLNHLCPLLTSALRPVQITVYTLLDKVISLLPAYEKDMKEEDSAQKEEISRSPPLMLMKVIEDCEAVMEVILSPVAIETMVTMASESEEYQFALGYLCAWQLLLRFFHSAPSHLRAEYAVFLRERSSVEHLMNHAFRLMPHTPTRSVQFPLKSQWVAQSPRAETSVTESYFASSKPELPIGNPGSAEDIQYIACGVYRRCLEVIPALVRQWWNAQDRKMAAYVDKFTSKNVTPLLCKSELQTVQDGDGIEGITVKARVATREVMAEYQLDEAKIELLITLPENYPLGTISVSSNRRVGINQAQWDRLLLQLSVFLQHQNGSIIEALQLWKKNIDRRFEGAEDCTICYAVVHGTNFQLPRLQCRTCRKKFHSACLYKWFNTSQNSSCPLCRNLWAMAGASSQKQN